MLLVPFFDRSTFFFPLPCIVICYFFLGLSGLAWRFLSWFFVAVGVCTSVLWEFISDARYGHGEGNSILYRIIIWAGVLRLFLSGLFLIWHLFPGCASMAG